MRASIRSSPASRAGHGGGPGQTVPLGLLAAGARAGSFALMPVRVQRPPRFAGDAKRCFDLLTCLEQTSDGGRRRPVEDVQAHTPVDDQAHAAQASQVLRQVCLAKAKAGFEVTNACLTLRQQGPHDFEPDWMTKRPKAVCRQPAVLHPTLLLYSEFAI